MMSSFQAATRAHAPLVASLLVGFLLLCRAENPRARSSDSVLGPGPVVVVIAAGPEPRALESMELLETMIRPSPSWMPWLGGRLILRSPAPAATLRLRAATGRLDPSDLDEDLILRTGAEYFGSWRDPSNSWADGRRLRTVRARLDDEEGNRGSKAVVFLTCSWGGAGLAHPTCRNRYREAVELLQEAANQGGHGLLFCLPEGAYGSVGTLWAVGPRIAHPTRPIEASVIDIGPTLTYLLGDLLPHGIDGRAMTGLVRFEFSFRYPIRWQLVAPSR